MRTLVTLALLVTFGCASTKPMVDGEGAAPDDIVIEACPAVEARAQVCSVTPCPQSYGIWMDRNDASDFACAVTCCRKNEEQLRKLTCPAPWKAVGVALLLGLVAGMAGTLYLTREK